MRLVTSFVSFFLAVSMTQAAGPELRFAGGTFRPQAKAASVAAATSPGGQRYLVAITREALDPEGRAALADAGAEVLDVLPVHGYRVRLSPEAEDDVRRLPFVVWLGPVPEGPARESGGCRPPRAARPRRWRSTSLPRRSARSSRRRRRRAPRGSCGSGCARRARASPGARSG